MSDFMNHFPLVETIIGAFVTLIVLRLLLTRSPSLKGLRAKRIIITGTSKGIGEELAYESARQGAHLILAARSTPDLERVAAECIKLGAASAKAVTCDCGKKQDRIRLIDEAKRFFPSGGIDMLVLNHTWAHWNRMDTSDIDRNIELLETGFNVNVLGYVHLASLVLKEMIANGGETNGRGSIVIVSSAQSIFPIPSKSFAYAASKAAICSYFTSLRNELNYVAIPASQRPSITICYLGAIATESYNKTEMSPVMKRAGNAASPAATAKNILNAGLEEKEEIYFPSNVWIMKILYAIFPIWIRKLLKAMDN